MTSPKRIAISTISVALLMSVAFAGFYFAKKYRLQKDLQKSEDEIKRGFWALAFETLDHHRHKLVSNEKDCATLLNVYANAKKPDRLEWTAQACLESGIENYSVYLSLAIAQELQGRDQDALQLLDQIIKKFDKEAEAYRRMAGIFLRSKDEVRAAEAMSKAAYRTEDPQIKLEAVQILLRQNRGDDAMTIALSLRDVPTENPEVRLIVARALIAGRDSTGGVPQIDQARSMMTKLDPERIKQIEHDYADVLSSKHKP